MLGVTASYGGEIGKPGVKAAAKPVFSTGIAPIIFRSCTSCHRPGEAAPFTLMSYQDVKKRGALIAAVTQSRYMPPWHATPGYGDFIDVHRLSDEEIATIKQWVDSGMPEGDPAKTPALPKFPEGWQLGKPDIVLTMPQAFDLPASGSDIYRNFTIPMDSREQVGAGGRISAKRPEGRPSRFVLRRCDGRIPQARWRRRQTRLQRRARRRALCEVGRLGGWAVGGNPHLLPAGLAYPLPKGSDFVLQVHFHLTGKAEREQSTIGIYLADKAPEQADCRVQVPALFGVGNDLDIPAGEKAYVMKDSFTCRSTWKASPSAGMRTICARTCRQSRRCPMGPSSGCYGSRIGISVGRTNISIRTPCRCQQGRAST